MEREQPARPALKPEPVNPSPKYRFLKSKELTSAHRALLDAPQMEKSLDYAELEYMRYLCGSAPSDISSPTYITASAACFQRIQGMHEFIAVFRGLAEPTTALSKRTSDNLDHS